MKKLPIGIQSFPTIINRGFAYVDKTKLIYLLLEEGISYFYARPRRFGKSLLLSTLAALFAGERDLFKGLWIDRSNYEWKSYPVVMLNFADLDSHSPDALSDSLNRYLVTIAARLGLNLDLAPRPAETLSNLLSQAAGGKEVVVLIDEYDRPLVKNIHDAALVRANREALQDFFAVLKSHETFLRFLFVTGVSKFTKVSLFSGMNSLFDISLDAEYTALTGLSEREIEANFRSRLQQLAKARGESMEKLWDQMRLWYNGYCFSRLVDSEKVYNPWSLFNFFRSKQLENYWFETGTPTFALQLIKQQHFPLVTLGSGFLPVSALGANQELEQIDLPTFLFQIGYLTIDRYDSEAHVCYLKFPNEEVRRSFFEHLFVSYFQQPPWQRLPLFDQLKESLQDGKLGSFFDHFNTLLAAIPYPLHLPAEGYYHSLLYLCLQMLGFSVNAEICTSQGRIDLVVEQLDRVYVLEFKLDRSAEEALDQVMVREYARRYRGSGKKLILVGANFSSTARSIDEWRQAAET
jgi:hypothetical protein